MIDVTVTGRIINNTSNSDKNYVYTPANGDKPSWMHFLMSVRQEGAQKDPQTGYYPTFLLPCRAFGETANQIDQYAGPGSKFGCKGVLMKSDPYIDKETGAKREGSFYLKVQRVIYECLDAKPANGAQVQSGTPSVTGRAAAGGIMVNNHKSTNAATLKRPAAVNATDPF